MAHAGLVGLAWVSVGQVSEQGQGMSRRAKVDRGKLVFLYRYGDGMRLASRQLSNFTPTFRRSREGLK